MISKINSYPCIPLNIFVLTAIYSTILKSRIISSKKTAYADCCLYSLVEHHLWVVRMSTYLLYCHLCSRPRLSPVTKRDHFSVSQSFSPSRWWEVVRFQVVFGQGAVESPAIALLHNITPLFSYIWLVWMVFCSPYLPLLA